MPTEHPQVVRVRVYTDRAGETRWTGYAGNSRKVANSGEGYIDARDCFAAVASLFPQATVKDERSRVENPVVEDPFADEERPCPDAAAEQAQLEQQTAEGTWEEIP